MSKNWNKYSEELQPLIKNFINKNIDHEVTSYLQKAYGFYSFYSEKLDKKATINKDFYNDVAPMLCYLHDNFRALIALYSHMHLSPLAFCQRAIFESLCTAKYLFKDPKLYFDLYNRFKEVEKYLAFKNGVVINLTNNEIQHIKSTCPEWFLAKKDGTERVITSWTARDRFSFKKMTKELKMEEDYALIYSNSSKFLHFSPNIINVYQDSKGMSPVPVSNTGTFISLISSYFALEFLREIYLFLGIHYPDKEHSALNQDYLILIKKYES